MPFTRIALRAGKPAGYRVALMQGIQRALVATFNVPHDDLFMVVSEQDEGSFLFDRRYLGIERSDDLVMIQIAANNTRTVEQKKARYRRIDDELADNPGVRKEDVLIDLVEVLKENWSFGNGIAQCAT